MRQLAKLGSRYKRGVRILDSITQNLSDHPSVINSSLNEKFID